MPMIRDNLCPRCGLAPSHEPERAGAVLTCPKCGFLGIWDVHYWREPTDTERTALLSQDGFITTQLDHIELGLCMMADRERMRCAIETAMSEWMHSPGHPELIDKLVVALQREGFHTHRDPIEVPE